MTERPMSLFSHSLVYCSAYGLHLWGRGDAFCETGVSSLLLTAEVKPGEQNLEDSLWQWR